MFNASASDRDNPANRWHYIRMASQAAAEFLAKPCAMIPRLMSVTSVMKPCDQGNPRTLWPGVRLMIAPFRTKAQHFLLQQQEFVEVFFSLHYRVQRTMLSTSPAARRPEVANVAPSRRPTVQMGKRPERRLNSTIAAEISFNHCATLTSSLSLKSHRTVVVKPQNGKSGFSEPAR